MKKIVYQAAAALLGELIIHVETFLNLSLQTVMASNSRKPFA